MKRIIILTACVFAAVFCFAQPYIPAVGIGNTSQNNRMIMAIQYQGQNGKPVWVDFDSIAQRLSPYFPGGGGALDTPFVYLRDMEVGETYSGLSTVTDWVNWHRFAPPTLALNLSPTSATYQIGTVNSIDLNTITTNPASATLGTGYIRQTAPDVDTLATWSGTNGTFNISFSPQQSGSGQFNEFSYTFIANQSYSGIEAGTVASSNRVLYGVYPVLYFTSSTDYTSSTAGLYTAASKLVQTEGNKTVPYSGTNVYIYYCIPKTWSDYTLSEIIDGNGFNVTPAFTSYDVNISSSGLANNWTNVAYKMYRINSLTTVNADYTFNR